MLCCIPIHTCVGTASSTHRGKRKNEWLPISDVLRQVTPLSESLCEIIAIYTLHYFFKVIVVPSRYDTVSIDHMQLDAHDAYYRASQFAWQVPDECFILKDIEHFQLNCIPYYSTIEDIRCEDYKCSMHLLKKMEQEYERDLKVVYKPVSGLRYRYYEDYECTQRIPNNIVLYDLPVYIARGYIDVCMYTTTSKDRTRRIYRKILDEE
jgi:hypothetical protein